MTPGQSYCKEIHSKLMRPRKAGLGLILSVFVVDDEPLIASTLTHILKDNGYDARCFVNPLEALEAARMSAPDLLISDVIMPGLSGVDLAIHFKKQCPTCKVLLIAGRAATDDLLEAARAQGHDFHLIAKPFHPTDLLALINDLT
jgi:DNA-binding NtrC family response regulator